MKKVFLPFVNHRYVSTVGVAGDFTASQHLEFLLKAEEEWADGKYNDDLIAHVDSIKAYMAIQTGKFQELDNKDKDNIVMLTWIKTCGITTSDLDRSTDICDIDAPELETDALPYEMTLSQKSGFKINIEDLRTNIYTESEIIAKGLMKADKELAEWWCKQFLLFLKANVGPNIPVIEGISAPMTWDDANTTTDIPASGYGVDIVANLIQQMQLNIVNSGLYINRGTLFQAWTNAGLNGGNLDGKGDDERTKQINLAFDMWNFRKAGLTEDMFLIDRNAVAIKTYTRYTDDVVYIGGKINHTVYRMPSNVLPGVYWDVIYQMTCVAGEYFHTWQLMTKGGIFLNPEPCPITIGGTEYTPTGIYSFTKTA